MAVDIIIDMDIMYIPEQVSFPAVYHHVLKQESHPLLRLQHRKQIQLYISGKENIWCRFLVLFMHILKHNRRE